ncbi:MAG: diaminopimelate epimerase [Acidimicrobiia bacterium]|nr:diaminopimelate epimerase [Acidimicrobiia bacterium]
MDFVKMEGLGNDFVVVTGPMSPTAEQVAEWCDRRRGIGADGVLVVGAGEPVTMGYWNADGSAAEMCGNGLRCVARYARLRGMAATDTFVVNTPIGPRRVEVKDATVRVELGSVVVSPGSVEIAGYRAVAVNVGNPHAVVFVADCYSVPVAAVGPLIETDPAFPGRANAGFATVVDTRHLALRVWERGVGETLACGTGAAAAVAAAHAGGLTDPSVTVRLPGGDLEVEILEGVAWIEGPARVVYAGAI